MKIIRKSYIPNINSKENIASKTMMLVSFMIMLVLFVMLLLSNLNNIQTIIKVPYIEKIAAEVSNEYSAKSNELEQLKNEIVELKQKKVDIEGNAELYDSLNNISGLRIKVAQSLRSSLDTKGILRDNANYIFVNEYGNLSLLNSYVFESTEASILTQSATEGVKLLGEEIYSIMQDKTLSRFIKCFAIESHLDNNEVNEASKILASQRAQNYLNELLNSNEKLKNEYGYMFISSNYYNNKEIKNKTEGIEDYSRIEISVYIDEAAIEEGVSKLFE